MSILFNRYTHSHIKYRGKYIDKDLIYRSHVVVDSDFAKRRHTSTSSLSLPSYFSYFINQPIEMRFHRPSNENRSGTRTRYFRTFPILTLQMQQSIE